MADRMPRDIEDPSMFARVLAGVGYPATPRSIADHATALGATHVAVAVLELPDRSYEDFGEVAEALGYDRG